MDVKQEVKILFEMFKILERLAYQNEVFKRKLEKLIDEMC